MSLVRGARGGGGGDTSNYTIGTWWQQGNLISKLGSLTLGVGGVGSLRRVVVIAVVVSRWQKEDEAQSEQRVQI